MNVLNGVYEDLKQRLSVEKDKRRRAERREECLWEILDRRVKYNLDLISKIESLRMKLECERAEGRTSNIRFSGRRDSTNARGQSIEQLQLKAVQRNSYNNNNSNDNSRDRRSIQMKSREREQIGQHRRRTIASTDNTTRPNNTGINYVAEKQERTIMPLSKAGDRNKVFA